MQAVAVEPAPVPATTPPIETPGEGGETSPTDAAAEEPTTAGAAAEVEGEQDTPATPTATVAAAATRLNVGIASLPSSPLRPSSAPAARSRAEVHSPATPHRPHPSGVPKCRPQSAAVSTAAGWSGSGPRNVHAVHDARQPPMPRQPVRALSPARTSNFTRCRCPHGAARMQLQRALKMAHVPQPTHTVDVGYRRRWLRS
jgi:hypothetical protein